VPEKEQVLHSVAQRVHVVVVTIVVSAAVAVAGACEGVVADVGVPLPPHAESNTLQHAKVVGKLSLFFLNFCFLIENFIKPSQADFRSRFVAYVHPYPMAMLTIPPETKSSSFFPLINNFENLQNFKKIEK
jgi:hypothetical protein